MPTYFPRRCFECDEEGGDILKYPLKSMYTTLNRENNETLSKIPETIEDILAERKFQIKTKAELKETKRNEFLSQLVNKIVYLLNKTDVMDVTHSVNIQGEMSTEEFRAEPQEAVFYDRAIPSQVKFTHNSSINHSEEQRKSINSTSANELCPMESQSQRNIVLADEINKNKRFPQVSMVIYELDSGDKYDESCTEKTEGQRYSEDFTKTGEFFLSSAAPRIVSEASYDVLEGTELESIPDTGYSYSEQRHMITRDAFHTETDGRKERSAQNENNEYTNDKTRINKPESVIVIDNLPFQLMNIPFLTNSESRKNWPTTNLTLPKAESFSSLKFFNGSTEDECVNHPNAEYNNHFPGSFTIHPEMKEKKIDDNGFKKGIQWGIKPLRVTDLKHIYESMIMNSNVDPPFYIIFQTTEKSNENRMSHFIKYNEENEKSQGINVYLTTQRSNESVAKPSFQKHILNPYESHNYNLFLTTTKPNNKDSQYYNKYKKIKIDKAGGSILQTTKSSYGFPMIQMLPLSVRDNGFIQDPNLFLTTGKKMQPIDDNFKSFKSFLDNNKPDNSFFTTKTPEEIFGITTKGSYEKVFSANLIPKKEPFLFNVITQAMNNENENLESNGTDIEENNITTCYHVFDSERGCIEEKRVLESTTQCPHDAYTYIESNEMEMSGQKGSDKPNVILLVDEQGFENTTLSDKHNESNQGTELHSIEDRFNLSQREIIPLKIVPLPVNHFCNTVTSDLEDPNITVTYLPIEVEKPFHQSTDNNFNKLGVALCFFFSTLMPEYESRSTSEACQDSQSESILINNNSYYIHPDFVNETNTSSVFDNKKLRSEVYPKNKSISAKITSKQRPSHKPIPIIIEELEDALENPQEVYGDYYYYLDSDVKSDQNKQDNDNETYSRLINNALKEIKYNTTLLRSNQNNINPGIFNRSFISSEPKKTLSQFNDFQNYSGLKNHVPSSTRTHSYYGNGRLDLRRNLYMDNTLNCKNIHYTKQPFLNYEKINNGRNNEDSVNYVNQDPNDIYVSPRRMQPQKMPDLVPWELQNANIKDSDEFYQYNKKKITDEFSDEFFEDHGCRSLKNELNEEDIGRCTGVMKSLETHFTPVSIIRGNNLSNTSSKRGKVYVTANGESFSTNTTAVSRPPKSGISLFFENLFHNRRTTKDTNANQNVTENLKNAMNSKTAQSLLKNGLDSTESNFNINNKSYVLEHYLPEFQKMKREKRTPVSKKADKHKPPMAIETQRFSRMLPRSDLTKLTEPEKDFYSKFQSLQKDLQELQNSIMTQSKQLPDKEKNLTLQIRVIVDVVNNTFSPDVYGSDQLRKRQAEKMEKLEDLNNVPNTTEETMEIIPIIIDHDTPLKEDKLTRGNGGSRNKRVKGSIKSDRECSELDRNNNMNEKDGNNLEMSGNILKFLRENSSDFEMKENALKNITRLIDLLIENFQEAPDLTTLHYKSTCSKDNLCLRMKRNTIKRIFPSYALFQNNKHTSEKVRSCQNICSEKQGKVCTIGEQVSSGNTESNLKKAKTKGKIKSSLDNTVTISMKHCLNTLEGKETRNNHFRKARQVSLTPFLEGQQIKEGNTVLLHKGRMMENRQWYNQLKRLRELKNCREENVKNFSNKRSRSHNFYRENRFPFAGKKEKIQSYDRNVDPFTRKVLKEICFIENELQELITPTGINRASAFSGKYQPTSVSRFAIHNAYPKYFNKKVSQVSPNTKNSIAIQTSASRNGNMGSSKLEKVELGSLYEEILHKPKGKNFQSVVSSHSEKIGGLGSKKEFNLKPSSTESGFKIENSNKSKTKNTQENSSMPSNLLKTSVCSTLLPVTGGISLNVDWCCDDSTIKRRNKATTKDMQSQKQNTSTAQINVLACEECDIYTCESTPKEHIVMTQATKSTAPRTTRATISGSTMVQCAPRNITTLQSRKTTIKHRGINCHHNYKNHSSHHEHRMTAKHGLMKHNFTETSVTRTRNKFYFNIWPGKINHSSLLLYNNKITKMIDKDIHSIGKSFENVIITRK